MEKQICFKRALLAATLVSCYGWSNPEPASSVQEDYSVNNEPLPSGASFQQEGQRLRTISTETVHGDLAKKNPAFLPQSDFFITADVFYWKGKQDNLDFVVRNDQTVIDLNGSSVGSSEIYSEILEPHFRWDWGFRIDTGYVFSSDNWELDCIWTHFREKAHASTSAVTGAPVVSLPSDAQETPVTISTLMPSWGQNFLGNYASSASSHWTLTFNTIDLELARNYFASKTISIRPHVGVRGALIHQNYRADYIGTVGDFGNLVLILSESIPTSMKAKNNYWGVGPRLGADLFWQIFSHWGFYGNCSASLLYGQFNVRQKYSGGIPSLNSINTTLTPGEATTHQHPRRVRINIDSAVGLEWEFFWDQKKTKHMTLGAGYEISYWFLQNQLIRTGITEFLGLDEETITTPLQDNRDENGDLGLQGWNFHVRLDF